MRSTTLLVCSLAACGGPADSTIDISHDVCAPISVSSAHATSPQVAGIDQAVALWRAGGVSELTHGGAAGLAGSPGSIEIRFEAASLAFHGLYDDEHGIIYVNTAISDPEALSIVIAHELGHAFGLEHVAAGERTSLMNPGNLVIPPNDGDRLQLQAMWGLCDQRPIVTGNAGT